MSVFVKPLLAGHSGTFNGKISKRNAKLCAHQPLDSTWATASPAWGPLMEGQQEEEETRVALLLTALTFGKSLNPTPQMGLFPHWKLERALQPPGRCPSSAPQSGTMTLKVFLA